MSPTPNPHNVKIKPITAVTTKPMNTAAGTFLTYNTKVIAIPINAKRAGAENNYPNAIKVEGSSTIIPAPFKPMNAKKKTIPAPIANFKL